MNYVELKNFSKLNLKFWYHQLQMATWLLMTSIRLPFALKSLWVPYHALWTYKCANYISISNKWCLHTLLLPIFSYNILVYSKDWQFHWKYLCVVLHLIYSNHFMLIKFKLNVAWSKPLLNTLFISSLCKELLWIPPKLLVCMLM